MRPGEGTVSNEEDEDEDEEEEEDDEVEVEEMEGMKLERNVREDLMSMVDKKPKPPNTPSKVGSTLAQYSSAEERIRASTRAIIRPREQREQNTC
jgi:hypothetical protein